MFIPVMLTPRSGDIDPSVSERLSVGQSCFDLSKQAFAKLDIFS